jgi:ribosomal protein RSM22 (predicted rRNA methylase)
MDEALDALVALIGKYLYGEAFCWTSSPHPPASKLAAMGRGVTELSRLYTRERKNLSSDLLKDPSLREAYLGYFLLCNLGKVRRIFREIQAHPKGTLHFSGKRRLLDIGCGPGTNLLGFLSVLDEGACALDTLECAAVDSISANLRDAEYLFRCYAETLKVSRRIAPLLVCQAHLSEVPALGFEARFDFIVFGNVLNELFADCQDRIEKRYQLVATVVDKWLTDEGFLILIEPALRQTSRDLLLLRDQLLDQTSLRVYAPCVHNLHCPAVAPSNLTDWCHEDRPWLAPQWIQAIDALVGNCKDSLKYSYTVLSRSRLSVAEAAYWQAGIANGSTTTPGPDAHTWRVVSDQMEEKGKTSIYLCGSLGRAKVTRLQKHDSEHNREFGKLARGRVVETKGLNFKSPRDWRVDPKTRVRDLM